MPYTHDAERPARGIGYQLVERTLHIIAYTLCVATRAVCPSDTMRLAVTGVNLVETDSGRGDELHARTA